MPLCNSTNVGVSYHPQRLHALPDWVLSVMESFSWYPNAVPSSHVITAGGAELVVVVVDLVVVVFVDILVESGRRDVATVDLNEWRTDE
jgi:hypothetical protein